MAPPESKIQATPASSAKAHCLKAAIFQSLAFKKSPELNNNKLTIPIKTAFLKVLNM